MRIPLRYQFMLPVLAVAVGSLSLVAVINGALATRQTHARIEAQLRDVAEVLTASSFPLTEPVLRQIRNLSSAEFVLVDERGQPLAASLDVPDASMLRQFQFADSQGVSLDREVTLGGVGYFHSSVAVEQRPGVARRAVLHILFPQAEYVAAWRAAFLPPLVVGGLAAVLVALVAQLVAYRVCRATGQLGTEVQRLAEGDFTPVELPRLDDEMRDLAKAVNATAEQLERYQQELRHTEQLRTVGLLGAGIAHELRNAATGCRLAVDLHAEHCPTASDQDGLAVARRQLDLMENRLQRFLQLGKQPAPLKIQRVDLPRLVDEYVAMVAPLARHAGVELNWQIPSEPRWVSADSGILGQAVANLLLNAVEAAQKQAAATAFSNRDTTGQVVVQCSKQGEAGVELEIADTGAGPGAEVAGRLFDPFVTSKQEGVGLGLAVAKQVIDAHHGSIHWQRVDGWTRFRVWLPQSAEERN